MTSGPTITLYFDVSGMSCAANCAKRIEAGLKKHIEVEEEEVVVDFPSRRAKVVVPTYIKPQTVINWIKDIDPKFSAFYIPAGNEQTLYFSVKGLKTQEDAQKIHDMLSKQETLVADCNVNWATKTIKAVVVMPVKAEKKQQTIENLRNDIIQLLPDRKLEISQIETPNDETHSRIETKEYLHKSFLNLVVGGAFVLLSGFIPLPITFFGQLIGLGIGGITLGVMWATGKEFYQSAWREFWHHRSFNMNTLISLGTGSAWLYSMMLVLVPGLFPVAALQYQFLAVNMILGIINFGRAVRLHAEEEARQNTKKISNVYVAMQPQWVKRLTNYHGNFEEPVPEDLIEEVHYSQIRKGDILRVDVDEYVAVEGEILNPVETRVNQEAMTGESELCKKSQGDKLFSGTLNKGASIFVRASCAGDEARLIKIINESNNSRDKTSVSKNIDKIAKYFVPAIMLFALASGFGWFLFGPAPVLPWVIKTIMAVLLCACPCALALATPISLANAYRQFLRHHILVHDATAIETLSKTNAVVCDKTGTVTFPVFSEIFAEDPHLDRVALLQYAARLEREVDHPIATAFNHAAHHYSREIKDMRCVDVVKGDQGLSGFVDQKVQIHLGTADYLSTQDITINDILRAKEKEYTARGMTSVYVVVNKKCVAIVALEHQIRPEAKSDIECLKKMGIQVYMATGDKKEIAEKVAATLGILPQNVKAELSPAAKKAWIQALQKEGAVVAMVGDNVNDSLALNIADVSVAIGPWTNVSATSHVTIKTLNMATLILICRKTMENIYLNVIWALGYNVLSLTAASGALNPLGILLGPVAASFSMACSSFGVVYNSSRLNSSIEKSIDILKGRHNPPGFWTRINPLILLRSIVSALRAFFSVVVEKPKNTPPSPPRRTREAVDLTKVLVYDHRTGQFVRDGKPVNSDIPTLLGSSPLQAPPSLAEGVDLSLSGSSSEPSSPIKKQTRRNLVPLFTELGAQKLAKHSQTNGSVVDEIPSEEAEPEGASRPMLHQ